MSSSLFRPPAQAKDVPTVPLNKESQAPLVLVVDDQPTNIEVIQAALAGLRLRIQTASTGHLALKLIAQHEPAVVLLDVRMPGIDGFETAQRVRALPDRDHVPIIFVTAHHYDTGEGYELGAVDYIQKPIDPRAIRSKVQVFAQLFLLREHAREEAFLGDTLEKQAATLESSGAGLLLVESDGTILFGNSTVCRLLGYKKNALLGMPLPEVLLGERDPSFSTSLLGLLRPEKGTSSHARPPPRVRMSIRTTARDGNDLWLEVATAVTSNQGSVRTVVTLSDVSRQREQELTLRRQLRELAQANHDLDEFVQATSHDLRSPLLGIMNLCGWIAEELEELSVPGPLEHLTLLSERAQRLERLLSGLHRYAVAGRTMGPPGLIAWGALIAGLVENLGVPPEFKVTYRPDDFSLAVDVEALRKVLKELVSNAIVHNPKKRGVVELSIAECPGGHEIRIRDDAGGIPTELQAKVFKVFETLRRRDEVEGVGVGLPIALRIIQLKGGTMDLSNDGDGTLALLFWPDESTERKSSEVRC